MTEDKHLFNSETAKEARAKASPRGESKLKKLFKQYADEDDIKDLFDKLKEMALSGEMDAMKTMLAYLIGKPVETKNVNLDADINDKRKPSWWRPVEAMPLGRNQHHTLITSSEVRSELQ